MTYSHSFSINIFTLLLISSLALASGAHKLKNSCHPEYPAWNGQQRPPHQHTPSCGAPFTPYYVPDGSISIDDDHRSITYSPPGAWKATEDLSFVGGSAHVSDFPGANVTIKFTGTGIEWFGKTSRQHKTSTILIDGMHVGSVSLWSSKVYLKQRLFEISHLEHKEHVLTIVNDKSGWPHMDIDAFVVTVGSVGYQKPPRRPHAVSRDVQSTWKLEQKGQTGVAAMQLAIISDTEAIIIDKVEHNPLSINGHPAWGAIYNLEKHTVRPLNMKSNSFCAGGGFLGNGTLINVGGNPVVEDSTGSTNFGDKDGLQSIRLFTPCVDGNCDIYERPSDLHLRSSRWYPSTTRLDDGSAMIIGGATQGGWINNDDANNPTIEYFPPKRVGENGLVTLPFLIDTLNSNLFPIAFTLPDGRIFMAANNGAMIYDWRANSERRLPSFPNGVRVTYPMSGTAVLLPLTIANGYEPEVLICGGSSLDDHTPPEQLSARDPASNQCVRMILDDVGISGGWKVEYMPDARIMPDSVLLPDGRVVIVNGGRTGVAGYGNTKDQVGSSNADNPVYTPVLYDPAAPAGKRFSSVGMPTSSIARLYHSIATLTPDGSIMIAGSNPNLDRSNARYETEYRVEWLKPDYMSKLRPAFSKTPDQILYGTTFGLDIDLLYAVSFAYGPWLRYSLCAHELAPPSGMVYPPGPGWIYILADGIPSVGRKLMVGDGGNPP